VDKAMLLGTWIRRFLLEHLVAERNLAPNTQRSYRDTLVLLIPFVAKKAGKAVDHLSVVDMSAELIRLFLADLETSRRCLAWTRLAQHDKRLCRDRPRDEGKSSGQVRVRRTNQRHPTWA
jgi:site-specific recombinase XerD